MGASHAYDTESVAFARPASIKSVMEPTPFTIFAYAFLSQVLETARLGGQSYACSSLEAQLDVRDPCLLGYS
jgi:hypothetical protein